MGKFPPSMRSGTFSIPIMKKPSSTPESSPLPTQKLPMKIYIKEPSSNKKTLKTPPYPVIFNSPNLSDAKKTFDFIVSTWNKPLDFAIHNAVFKKYCDVGHHNDSVSFLNYMKQKTSFSPDRSTFNILLAQICKQEGNMNDIEKIIALMTNNGSPPDAASLDIAVRSLCSVDRIDDACLLMESMCIRYSKPDEFTYNSLIKHLCKCRTLGTVYEFIRKMENLAELKPNLMTYTILVDAVCRGKNLREALRLLQVLRESGFKPDCYLYNTIMKGFCILNRGSEAITVYRKMKEEGIEPDLVTYNTLIFGLSKAGRVDEAKRFLNVMAEMGHFPDVVTYTSLMNGMCRKGDALGAYGLVEEMETRGCSPNSCTYNTLLHGLSKSRHLDKGLHLYEIMTSGGMKLESSSYATFIRALCREDRIAEAYGVFDYAIESKSLTDVAAYSALDTSLKWLNKIRDKQ